MPKLIKGGRYNASISYKIALYSIDSRLTDTSLLNNRLRALAKEGQVRDIAFGEGVVVQLSLSARSQYTVA